MKKRVICHILYVVEDKDQLEANVRHLQDGLKELDFTVGAVSQNSDFRTTLDTIYQVIFASSTLEVKNKDTVGAAKWDHG
jgi:hypothetical protein